jgi:tetratricopeptide (TPR) repeat protein
VFLQELDRRVLPRWRDFKTTLSLGELSSVKSRDEISLDDQNALARLIKDWQENPTIWHAGDFLSSAFVVGDVTDLKEAASFILENREFAPHPLIELSERIVSPQMGEPIEVAMPLGDEDISQSIHRIRKRLSEEPRNAIQWVELARLYSILGDRDRALRAMSVGAALGPDHRFIVRSAARLFIHAHERSKALRVIRNASGARRDPWLLAAEIAVASASKSPSLLAKEGRARNDDDGLSLFERNELSSALATLELENGKNRRARQLFRQALESPNENSVAQVEWANRKIGGLPIEDPSLFDLPRSFEANAQLSLVKGNWRAAINQGTNWLLDQQFSKHPAIFTSYVSSLIEDYSRSIGILRASLKANPNEPQLVNNLAFALASNNQLVEAVEALRGADYVNVTGGPGVTLVATHGLVLFRTGNPDKGRELYRLAIERAAKIGLQKYTLMAALYLAREELLAKTPVAQISAEQALTNALKSEDKDVGLVADQVLRLLKQETLRVGWQGA